MMVKQLNGKTQSLKVKKKKISNWTSFKVLMQIILSHIFNQMYNYVLQTFKQ